MPLVPWIVPRASLQAIPGCQGPRESTWGNATATRGKSWHFLMPPDDSSPFQPLFSPAMPSLTMPIARCGTGTGTSASSSLGRVVLARQVQPGL